MARDLHSDKGAFRELIALTANFFNYEQSHVEKDYWISRVLRGLAHSEFKDKTFFKGGTSLSKAYDIIGRFSEDLDLFVFTGEITASKQAEKTLNKKISEYIIGSSDNTYLPERSKRGGNFNMLSFFYDSAFTNVGLKDYLEVEIKSCDLNDKQQMFYPFDAIQIEPIITTYLVRVKREDLIETYALMPFEMLCINPKRTICDKISRLSRISFDENAVDQLAKYIRDVYDLTLICQLEEYHNFIDSDEFFTAMNRVINEDVLYKNYTKEIHLQDATIFKNAQKIMETPQVRRAYNIDLSKLLFDKSQLPQIDEVVGALSYLHRRLIEFTQNYKH